MVGQASDACGMLGHTLGVRSSGPQDDCVRLGKHSGACATLGLSLAVSSATPQVAAALAASIRASKSSLAKAHAACHHGTLGQTSGASGTQALKPSLQGQALGDRGMVGQNSVVCGTLGQRSGT